MVLISHIHWALTTTITKKNYLISVKYLKKTTPPKHRNINLQVTANRMYKGTEAHNWQEKGTTCGLYG